MRQMLHLEGTGGFFIPYLGYIEATVRIPPIKDCEECVPMLVLKSFSPFSLRVPVQLGTMVLDQTMAMIMVEELTCTSSTWQQTYVSTIVTAGAAGTAEQGGHNIPLIDGPLVTLKSIVIPPFGCIRVKGLVQLLPIHSCQVWMITEPIASHWVTWGSMATNTYGDLCPGSQCLGMVLRNLPTREVCIPPKAVTGNVQTVEKVPDWEMLDHTSEDLPLKVQEELSKVS